MFRIPVSSLPLQKKQLLSKCVSMPPMYITIEKHKYDEIARAVVYEIQIGIQHGNDINTNTIRTRYSEMDNLDKQIRGTLGNGAQLRQFPAKKWIGNRDEEFLKQRSSELQDYMIQLLKVPGILQNLHFRKFFDIDYIGNSPGKHMTL